MILLGLVLWLFGRTLAFDYVLDDVCVINGNRFVRQGLAGWDEILTTFYWQGYWDTNTGIYRPLSLLTFSLEWQLLPGRPWLPHLNNLILYAASCVLLYYTLLRWLSSERIAFWGTLIFAAHPTHAEVVANIKGRDELLCFLSFLLTAWALERGKKRLAAVTFALCLMSKEGGLAYLGVFPLLLYYFRGNSFRQSLKHCAGLLIPTTLFLLIHEWVVVHATKPQMPYTYLDNALVNAPDALRKISTALWVQGEYLKTLFFPVRLSYDYSYAQIPIVGPFHPQVLAVIVLFCIAVGVLWRGLPQRNLGALGIAFYILTMALVSNLFFLIGTIQADRFLYAPSLGLILGLARWLDRPQRYMPTLLTILCFTLGARTSVRTNNWASNLRLFEHDVLVVPQSARAHYNFGTAYLEQVALGPIDPKERPQAFRVCQAAFARAIIIDPRYYEAYLNQAVCYYHLGANKEAAACAEDSLKISPEYPKALALRGLLHLEAQEWDAAITRLRKARSLGLAAQTTLHLARAHRGKREFGSALEYYHEMLLQQPEHAPLCLEINETLLESGDLPSALQGAEQLVDLAPDEPKHWRHLAAVYARLGKWAKCRQALTTANDIDKINTGPEIRKPKNSRETPSADSVR